MAALPLWAPENTVTMFSSPNPPYCFSFRMYIVEWRQKGVSTSQDKAHTLCSQKAVPKAPASPPSHSKDCPLGRRGWRRERFSPKPETSASSPIHRQCCTCGCASRLFLGPWGLSQAPHSLGDFAATHIPSLGTPWM